MQTHILTYRLYHEGLLINEDKHIYILYNLKGALSCKMEDETFVLKENDLLLVNSMQPLEIKSASFYVLFKIDYYLFRELYDQKRYRFFLNSTVEINDNIKLLAHDLMRFLTMSFEEYEYSKAELIKFEYEIIIFLVDKFKIDHFDFMLSSKDEKILDYIERRYKDKLTLSEISQDFYMTPQYFSRYFKEKNKTTFYNYLSHIRLEHAVHDLMISNKSLLHLALDHGFPNIDSFNTLFKKVYMDTPSNYRKKHLQKREEETENYKSLLKDVIFEHKRENEHQLNQTVMIDVTKSENLSLFFKEIINLGSIHYLNDYDIKQQLNALQKDLGFKYARINLDVPKNYVSDYSYYIEERTFDFLVNYGFKLWFVIDYRAIYQDLETYLQYLKGLLSHFANRYSIDTIRFWRFELSYRTLFNEEKCHKYFNVFYQIKAIVESFQCHESLYGPELILGYHQSISYFIDYAIKHQIYFEKLTFVAEPFQYYCDKGTWVVRRTKDVNYIKNKIVSIKSDHPNLKQCASSIYVVMWNDSVRKENILNDSCYRGAYIFKNIFECYGEVDALAYGTPLDLISGTSDDKRALSGSHGLISKHGIYKPAYYAYSFLNKFGNHFIYKDEYSLVTDMNHQNYQIFVHNCKALNHRYYLAEDNEIDMNIADCFDDLEDLTVNYCLKNIKEGTYIIKIRSISTEEGSVLDEMNKIIGESDLHPSDSELEYLKRICVPSILLKKVVTENHQLDLSVTLKANEFKYIHIIYLY